MVETNEAAGNQAVSRHFWSRVFLQMLVALPIVPYISSAAAEWEFHYETPDYVAFVDTESLGRRGNFVRAWVKYEYFSVQRPSYGQGFQSELTLRVFDCSERTSALLQLTEYSKPNLKGTSDEST